MSTTTTTTTTEVAVVKPPLPEDLQGDERDVADLWKEALRNYKGVVGYDLQPKFNNVKEMVDYGTDQMNNFHKFRHNDKKVDHLRSLFAANLDYIEKGAQQLIAAAVPAFPPAAAIGTALTYLLGVRRHPLLPSCVCCVQSQGVEKGRQA